MIIAMTDLDQLDQLDQEDIRQVDLGHYLLRKMDLKKEATE